MSSSIENIQEYPFLYKDFGPYRREIVAFEREITSLEKQLIALSKQIEQLEEERDHYKQIALDF